MSFPKGPRQNLDALVAQARAQSNFNASLEPDVQTDKDMVKLVPCTGCERPLAVNVFYAPAIAKCGECAPQQRTREKGSNAIPQAGRSDPATVADLTKVLINAPFARALCPVHPDDEAHEMELKSVNHNEYYGPSEFIGIKEGKAQYRQIAQGETVMHQCNKCLAVVTYSTTAQTKFRRVNEVGTGKHVNGWADQIGSRPDEHEEEEVA